MDAFQSFQAINSARDSAFRSFKTANVGSYYREADTMQFAYDSNESSAGLNVAGLDVDVLLNLDKVLGPGKQWLAQQIENKLLAAKFNPLTKDNPVIQAMEQKKVQEEIKNLLKGFNDRVEKQLARIAGDKFFIAHEEAKTQQIRKSYGSDMASSKGTSEEKESSIQDIVNAHEVGPGDIGTA